MGSSVALAMTLASVARAVEPIRLEYVVGVGCPGRSSFIERVRARTGLARFVNDETEAVPFVVEVHTEGSSVIGSVATGSSAPRRVTGYSCTDGVSALALITALTIDPQAVVTTDPEPAPAGSTDETRPGAPADASSSVARTPAPTVPPAAPRAAPGVAAELHVEAGPHGSGGRAEGWFWGPFGRVELSTGFEANTLVLFGGSVGVEVGRELGALFAPGMRIAGRFATSGRVTAAAAGARVELTTFRCELFAIRPRLGPLLVVPFTSVEVGVLKGHGESAGDIAAFPDRTRPWVALTEGLSIETPLGGPFFVSALAELREPGRRYGFVFQEPGGSIPVARVGVLEILGDMSVESRFR